MRITQAHISGSVKFFSKGFREKYGLRPYFHNDRPLAIFGMYRPEDYDLLFKHKQPIVVVWCGSDGMQINEQRAGILRSRPDAFHIAQSSFLSDDLKKWGIPHKVLPVTPAQIDLQPAKRGNAIYCYYGAEWAKNTYGYDLAMQVIDRTGLKAYLTTSKCYTREELIDVYKDCFIGLRLTKHDAVAVTVVELGMMGRRCVFNGDSPNSIKWSGVDDICESVIKEYENRHNDNTWQISQYVKDYINIGDQWLYV
jgi:hypothetical protein